MRVRRGIWLSRIVIGVLLGVAGLVGAVLLSSLTPRVLRRNQDWLRRGLFRRYNDVNRISAGTPRSLFALLHHVGRRSGRTYETPLGAIPYGDGFLLPLTYGRECDWCRNVFAAGDVHARLEGPDVRTLTSRNHRRTRGHAGVACMAANPHTRRGRPRIRLAPRCCQVKPRVEIDVLARSTRTFPPKCTFRESHVAPMGLQAAISEICTHS
jgi:deazaflavin-dependent oxidoreductase (nitroreductase family)